MADGKLEALVETMPGADYSARLETAAGMPLGDSQFFSAESERTKIAFPVTSNEQPVFVRVNLRGK